MKQILFFALKEDLLRMLEAVEGKGPLKYASTGNFLKSEIEGRVRVFDTGAEIPNLGTASADSSAACEAFLVCDRETPINMRTAGRDGERVCVDQLVNPDSVEFKPSGIWDKDVVLQGRIATASGSQLSQALMKRFQTSIKKTFSKVKSYYVGPGAYRLLQQGCRLTAATHSPPESDFRI